MAVVDHSQRRATRRWERRHDARSRVDGTATSRYRSVMSNQRRDGTAAVSWGPGRIDRFWVDFDGALIHQAFVEDRWQTAESLGGSLVSAPAVTAWAVGEMEVFGVMPDGELWNRYWDGTSWHDWESLGGDLDASEAPVATSWGPDRLDVFALGRDGTTWHRWWDGTRWVEWEQLAR